jgi:hypothetical protein
MIDDFGLSFVSEMEMCPEMFAKVPPAIAMIDETLKVCVHERKSLPR